MALLGKNILLGITGSIAAYKAAEIVRLLVKAGAHVKVIMTSSATSFIAPLTFGTLSKNPVLAEFSEERTGTWNNHVELGLWADMFLIAPATANTMSKLAHGAADNLLSAVYLSARCPVWIAPAMDHDMYLHGTTKQNISLLRNFGNHIIEPSSGELASGLVGEGRLREPSEIIKLIHDHFNGSNSSIIHGKNVLVSAGPTRESIDPVRFITNHSSGKMGVAIANELQKRGGVVTLINGPGVDITSLSKGISVVNIISANEMFDQVMKYYKDSDISIMAAAVADYTPENTSSTKIKKSNNNEQIALKPTKDILASMGERKIKGQLLIGFALETDNEEQNAISKLEKKNLDMIVLNSLQDEGAGFNTDTNKITIIDRSRNTKKYALKSKTEVAVDIADKIELMLK